MSEMCSVVLVVGDKMAPELDGCKMTDFLEHSQLDHYKRFIGKETGSCFHECSSITKLLFRFLEFLRVLQNSKQSKGYFEKQKKKEWYSVTEPVLFLRQTDPQICKSCHTVRVEIVR